MFTVPRVGAADVVDLVNLYASSTRLTAGARAAPYPDLPAFARVGASRATMIRAGDRLHPVFATPREAPALLNQLAAEVALAPHVDVAGALAWAAPRRRDALLAACTASLVEWIDDHGLGRHGICGADRCADVYVDSSRPGTRRYCSTSCLNRDRVASWRARQRGERS